MDSTSEEQPVGLTLPTVRFAWFAAITIILMFVFSMLVNPWWGYGLGITGLIVFVACFLPAEEVLKRLPGCIVAPVVIGVLVMIAMPSRLPGTHPRARDAEVKQNLHAIQLALEHYATDYGCYPVILEPLREEGYMPKFPRNPYMSKSMYDFSIVQPDRDDPTGTKENKYQHIITNEILTEKEHELWSNMRNISFTDQRFAGDFTYLPKLRVDESGAIVADGYTLLAYGLAKYGRNYRDHLYDGNPLDHVIIVLEDAGLATTADAEDEATP